MKCIYVSWKDVDGMCKKLTEKIKGYTPHVLIGISRGGLVPVRLLSDMLENRNVGIIRVELYKEMGIAKDTPKITQAITADVKGKRVLLVDDVADSGKSLAAAKKYIKSIGADEIKIATLHCKPKSMIKPDYFIKMTTDWVVYPWEVNEVKREMTNKK
ncbi:MAG: phosphoribosyltransferase [Candidatus Micrarchaeota archaeon]|nr:phosphoribosyltransferase [Candidatus Micrarchaeota archaeon]